MEQFRVYLQDKGLSSNSIKTYEYAAKQLVDRLSSLTDQSLLNHKDWLIESFTAKTTNVRIAAINEYLDYIEYGGIRLRGVKVQQKPFLDNVISNDEYCQLKHGLFNDGDYFWLFVIRFLACTGARISELRQFQVKHLTIGYMDVLSKGQKLRRIYIPETLRHDALIWCSDLKKTSGFLFDNGKNKPMSSRGISLGLKRLAQRYNVDSNVVYPHSFRHLFAKNFIKRNPDIAFLADLMGHKSIETTRVYLRKTTSEQRIAVNETVNW